MNKICVDVDVLNTIASDARRANSECKNAYQKINIVTKGTAWICREKKDINENLSSLNKQIDCLSKDFSAFASTADSVATNFRDYVYSIDKQYLKDMKSMIGIFGFASGEATNIVTNVSKKTQSIVKDVINKGIKTFGNYKAASFIVASAFPVTLVPLMAIQVGSDFRKKIEKTYQQTNSSQNSSGTVINSHATNGQQNTQVETNSIQLAYPEYEGDDKVGTVIYPGGEKYRRSKECVSYAIDRIYSLNVNMAHGTYYENGKGFCTTAAAHDLGKIISAKNNDDLEKKLAGCKYPILFSNYVPTSENPIHGHIAIIEGIKYENGKMQIYFTEGNNSSVKTGTLQKKSLEEFKKERIDLSKEPCEFFAFDESLYSK